MVAPVTKAPFSEQSQTTGPATSTGIPWRLSAIDSTAKARLRLRERLAEESAEDEAGRHRVHRDTCGHDLLRQATREAEHARLRHPVRRRAVGTPLRPASDPMFTTRPHP